MSLAQFMATDQPCVVFDSYQWRKEMYGPVSQSFGTIVG